MRRQRDGICYSCNRAGSKVSGTTLRSINKHPRYNELVHLYSFRPTDRANKVILRICAYCLREMKADLQDRGGVGGELGSPTRGKRRTFGPKAPKGKRSGVY